MDARQKVLDAVAAIPKGFVATYGQIAKAAGIKSPRAVGQIIHRNTDPENVPCHRVVFADGSLSTAYAFGGLKKQMEKLRGEGISFTGEKVVLSENQLAAS